MNNYKDSAMFTENIQNIIIESHVPYIKRRTFIFDMYNVPVKGGYAGIVANGQIVLFPVPKGTKVVGSFHNRVCNLRNVTHYGHKITIEGKNIKVFDNVGNY